MEELKHATDTTYEFKNGSYIKIIPSSDSKRGKRADLAIRQVFEYWDRYPDKYIEFVLGIKLPWYQKIILRLQKYGGKAWINYRELKN